jgi:hypothetical protein
LALTASTAPAGQKPGKSDFLSPHLTLGPHFGENACCWDASFSVQ